MYSFRPQCLVLTGPPNQRPALVDFVGSFTKHISLMICGDILMVSHSVPTINFVSERKTRERIYIQVAFHHVLLVMLNVLDWCLSWNQEQDRQTRPQDATDLLVKWMNKRKVRSFYTPFTADSLRVGARHLLQVKHLLIEKAACVHPWETTTAPVLKSTFTGNLSGFRFWWQPVEHKLYYLILAILDYSK